MIKTMIISIAKNLSVIRPESRPKFKEINATRPLVFIRTPKINDSVHENLPKKRVGIEQPTILEINVTKIMRIV